MYKNVTFFCMFIIVLLSISQRILASNEDDAIKSVIVAETAAYLNYDYDGWAQHWIHEPYARWHYTTVNFDNELVGWEAFNSSFKPHFENPDTASNYEIEKTNFEIHNYGSAAFVTLEEKHIYIESEHENIQKMKSSILLEKRDGEWKISNMTIVNKSAFSDTSLTRVEGDLNSMGHMFLERKQFSKAIEVFKLNVQLFPNSSNVYDSLGEAYMKNGDKDLAIVNYSKSLEFNPENKNAAKMLEELKE